MWQMKFVILSENSMMKVLSLNEDEKNLMKNVMPI